MVIMRASTLLFYTAFVSLALGACKSSTSAKAVDPSDDWSMHGGNYSEQQFSSLKQINVENVPKLGLLWSHEFGTHRGLEATPLVENGVIYTTVEWSVVYAMDARNGNVLWTFDPQVPRSRARRICCDVVNRGVALYHGKVYVGTLDGRLIALDAKTGTPVWDTVTFDQSKAYAITGAPRIGKGLILIGNAGAEYGVRGYISAYDAETGKLVWRTYTVPGDPAKGFESKALETAAKTWHGRWWEAGGGGTPWDSIVYDPELDLVYAGTGNGSTWYRALRSEGQGDNLYLASILALRGSTGELVWHFQVTPGDNWDYDATQPLMLAELKLNNRARKVIMQASKNGFFYILDRGTGEFISAKPFVGGITWATGIDAKSGRPMESSTGYDGSHAVLVSPDTDGAHNWFPMAFDPEKGLVYLPAKEGSAFLHAPDPGWKYDPQSWNRGQDERYSGPLVSKLVATAPAVGKLIAWNPVEGRQVWQAVHPSVESGGVLATAGNLVFQGRPDGIFLAYDAANGKKLWEYDAGTGIMAPPVTYTVGGEQYVTVTAGWGGVPGVINPPGQGATKPGFGRILTFAIGVNANLEVPPFGHTGPPKPAMHMNASRETVHEGAVLYSTYCLYCHGVNAVAGALPDLRYASAEVHKQFGEIVLGGVRESRGMPSFKDVLDEKKMRAIEAFVLARAEESAKPVQGENAKIAK
jgi:PQQ-dependent dehydrogenase (methanol/ethanol family)